MLASELYYKLTGKSNVYNIMPIENIPSVLQHGILCFDQMKQLHHSSIAMSEVQERRNKVEIPNGYSLHQYANLYFSYHNPMLYKRQNLADKLCVLALSARVMDIEGCVFADRNAATSLVRFYSPIAGMENLDFDKIHARFWTDPNPLIAREKKAIKCAEVLIPHSISPEYIIGAYVVSDEAAAQLTNYSFDKQIAIEPRVFYR